MGHSVKSEYHIWVILQSCVPKVWHLSPKSKMAASFSHLTSTVSEQKHQIGLSDVACLNAKKNGWKTISCKRSSMPMHKLMFIQQSTIHCISTRSPMWPILRNGFYKLCHSLRFQESTWSTEAWRFGLLLMHMVWFDENSSELCFTCKYSRNEKLIRHTSIWKHDLANTFESQILISNWYLLFWYGCRWTPHNGGVWAINKIVY